MMYQLTNGPENWIYAYTADDERILQYRIGGGSWQTAIRDLDGKILREYRTELGGWTAFEDYVYRDGALLASVHPTEGTRWFGIDHLGSPRIRFNTAGAIAGVHTYYPFGEEATPGTGDTQQMKFTGHERDMLNTPTGFADDTDYMHARQFSILTGRFHSFDPIGGSPRAPQSWNAYAYVLGNPMRYVDPTGMDANSCDLNLGPCPAGTANGFGDTITVTGGLSPFSPAGFTNWLWTLSHGGPNSGSGQSAGGGVVGSQLRIAILVTGSEAARLAATCSGAIGSSAESDEGICDAAFTAVGMASGPGGGLPRKPGPLGQFKGRDALRAENNAVRDALRQLGLRDPESRRIAHELAREEAIARGSKLSFGDLVELFRDFWGL